MLNKEWMRTCSGIRNSNQYAVGLSQVSTQSDAKQCENQSLGYLFALRRGRVVTIVGQVSSEDVELAGNHPPRVPHFDLVFWGQEDPELAGREGGRWHCWALPRAQPTQRAVRHLQEHDEINLLLVHSSLESLCSIKQV